MTTTSKPKRGFFSLLKRLMLGFLALLLILIAGVLAGGALVRAQVRAGHPAPGQMVDVGGYRLHIHCEGQGSPSVIILAGSGVPSPYYHLIQAGAAQTTRVCVYDRAGYAWSEQGEGDLSPLGQVEDLNRLLTGAGIEPPYILAGHSYGGYLARLYASTYPESVAGLVMIDSAHEDQWANYPPSIRDMGTQMFTGPNKPFNLFLMYFLRSLQTILPISDPMASYFPPEVAETLTAVHKLHPLNIYTVKAEVSAMVQGTSPAVTDLGDVPMVVITHGVPIELAGQSAEDNAEFDRVNLEMQRRLLALSPNSRQVIAEQSNHDEIPVKQADLVVQAINDLLSEAD